MAPNATTTLFDIPEDIFRTGLFPCFRVNELLRLRRVARWIKGYVDDYLQNHPRSSNSLVLVPKYPSSLTRAQDRKRSWNTMMTLSTFLQQDETSSIRMPIILLSTERATYNYDMRRFLRNYENQLWHLKVQSVKIPFTQTARTFFKKCSQLKTLRVHEIVMDHKANKELDTIAFPPSFKLLTTIDFSQLKSSRFVCDMVQFCTGLKYFVLPSMNENVREGLSRFQEILKGNELTKLQYLNLSAMCFVEDYVIHGLCEISIRHGLLLANFCHENLFRSGIEVKDIADRLRSITCINRHDLRAEHMVLPNVDAAEAVFYPGVYLRTLKIVMTRAAFPNLKMLELEFQSLFVVDTLWENFPNLEELCLKFNFRGEERPGNKNPIFFGSNVEHPSFLQLVGLRKLTLFLNTDIFKGLTDAVFSEIFRHIPLRELYLISDKPIKTLTQAGIRQLLDPNYPFFAYIEKFPFHDWTLDGMEKEEFESLAKEFPCNWL